MITRSSVVRLVGVLMLALVASCGNATGPAEDVAAPVLPSSSTPVVRFAAVKPVLRDVEGVTYVVLQVVEEATGDVVFEAIGTDPYDPSEAGTIEWTPMREGLLIQVRSAMKSLGWTKVDEGVEWYAIRYRGTPDSRIMLTEAPSEPAVDETATPVAPESSEPAESAAPTGGGLDDVDGLVALLGRSTEDDPELQGLMMTCGYGSGGSDFAGSVECIYRGFRVDLDSDSAAYQVTVYNQEDVGQYEQYAGTLPYGLSWDDNYDAVLAKMGPPVDVWGGSGVEVQMNYVVEGLKVAIMLTATHQRPEELVVAAIHTITFSRA